MTLSSMKLEEKARFFRFWFALFSLVLFLVCVSAAQASGSLGAKPQEKSLEYEWEQIQSLLNNRAFHDALNRLSGFRAMADRAGVGNLEMHARAILARVQALDPATAAQYGSKLVDAAETLSPRLAASRGEKLRGIAAFGEWGQLPIDFVDMFRWAVERQADRLALLSFVFSALSLSVLLTVFLALMALLYRLAPVFYHVVSHYPGFALPKKVYGVLILSGVFLLSIEGYGLIGAALIVAAPCFLVAQRALRGLLFAITVLSVVLLFTDSQQRNFLDYYQSPLVDIMRCLEGTCDAEFSRISQERVAGGPLEGLAAYARGLAELKRLRVKESEKEFALAEERGFSSAAFDTARGNALLLSLSRWCPERPTEQELKGVADKAAGYYERAMGRGSADAAAIYNLALLYELLGDSESTDRFFEAFSLRTEGFVPPTRRRVQELKPFSPCSPMPGPVGFLAWGSLSDSFVRAVIEDLRLADNSIVATPFQEVFLGTNPPHFLVVLLASFFVIVLASGLWVGKTPLSRRCGQCHQVFCRLCGETGTHTDHCPECIMDQLKISPLDPKTVWLKQNERQASVQRSARWTFLVSVVVPGLGNLFAGPPIRGLLLVWFWCLAIALMGGPLGYFWGWSPRAGFSGFLGSTLALLFLLGVYLYGIADAMEFRERRRS